MTPVHRIATIFVWAVATLAVVFLLAPLVVTVLVAFSSSSVFALPPPEWSLRWFERLPNARGLWPALATSLQVAVVSTAIALVLGTLCAIGVVRGRFRGREALVTFMVSPLMMPGLVLGIAMLQFFREFGLRDVYAGLLIAHVVITLPYVMRTVTGSLALFDFALVDAARTLGCSYPAAILKVVVPVLAPAFVTSALFAFLASLDNYPISIFFTDAWTKTLPIQMLQYVEENPNPVIAAISTGLIALTVAILIVADRLVGLRRLASF
jgi:putative spermidine/putrescine transport system permease protein